MAGEPRKGKALWAKTQSQIRPVTSFTMKFHSSSRPREIRRGPAFWVKTTEDSPKAQVEFQPQPRTQWEVEDEAPAQSGVFGKVTWWQISALVLVTAALTMFFVLISLINVYMQKADDMYEIIPELESLEQRLRDAIKREAGTPALTCKPCKPNWLQWADNCYLGTREPMPWRDCLDHCRSYGANLLIGKTSGEMKFLSLEARKWLASGSALQIAKGYWVGLKYNLTQKSWNWADGTILHLKLHMNEKQPSFLANTCMLFGENHVLKDRCSSINSCLCKRSV